MFNIVSPIVFSEGSPLRSSGRPALMLALLLGHPFVENYRIIEAHV